MKRRTAREVRRHTQRLCRGIAHSLTPDLLKPRYRKLAVGKHRTFGHCYAASEALWHMLGGMRSSYRPHVLRLPNKGTHWYLRHKDSGKVLDPTGKQFEKPVRYENGRCCGYLTKRPSKRASIVIERTRDWLKEHAA